MQLQNQKQIHVRPGSQRIRDRQFGFLYLSDSTDKIPIQGLIGALTPITDRPFNIQNQQPLLIGNLAVSEVSYAPTVNTENIFNMGHAEHKLLGRLEDLIEKYKGGTGGKCPAFVILGSRWTPCSYVHVAGGEKNGVPYNGYIGCTPDYIIEKKKLKDKKPTICEEFPKFYLFAGQGTQDTHWESLKTELLKADIYLINNS